MTRRPKYCSCSDRTLALVKREIARRGMKRLSAPLIKRVLGR